MSTLTGNSQVTVPAELAKEMELEQGKTSKLQVLKRVQEIGEFCKRDLIKELIEWRERDE